MGYDADMARPSLHALGGAAREDPAVSPTGPGIGLVRRPSLYRGRPVLDERHTFALSTGLAPAKPVSRTQRQDLRALQRGSRSLLLQPRRGKSDGRVGGADRLSSALLLRRDVG